MARADLLVLPSIREFGGGVVLEAMAVGLVPLVVDYGGPAELVTGSTGFRLPLGSRERLVARLRAELERLAEDPGAIDARSAPARRRVARWFTWERKAEQLLAVYEWVVGRRTQRPDFGRPFPDAPEAQDAA